MTLDRAYRTLTLATSRLSAGRAVAARELATAVVLATESEPGEEWAIVRGIAAAIEAEAVVAMACGVAS